MRTCLLNACCFLLLLASNSKSNADDLGKAIVEINQAPDWRSLPFPSDGSEAKKLVNTLMKYANYTPENAREIVKRLAISLEPISDLKVGGKIYIFNRLYCNVPRHSERVGWKVFGGWGGIGVGDNTIDSLYPLILKDGEFTLEQFSGYGGGNYQGLEEFEWLLKRFGQRYKAIAAVPNK